MAPKNDGKKPSSSTSSAITLDPDQIPEDHQITLDLNGEKVDYFFDGLIWMLRCLVSMNGRKMNEKTVIIGKHEVFLVTLELPNNSTKAIIQKKDVYVVAVFANGLWVYPSDSDLKIAGGVQGDFSKSYPGKFAFKVGIEVLKESVGLLNTNASSNWANAYYNLAANISEPTRFYAIHEYFHYGPSTALDRFHCLLVKNWGKLSKLWKLYRRYHLWNPTGLAIFELQDFERVSAALAVVLDVCIDVEIGTCSNLRLAVVDGRAR